MKLHSFEVEDAKDDPNLMRCLLGGQEYETVLLEGTTAQGYGSKQSGCVINYTF